MCDYNYWWILILPNMHVESNGSIQWSVTVIIAAAKTKRKRILSEIMVQKKNHELDQLWTFFYEPHEGQSDENHAFMNHYSTRISRAQAIFDNLQQLTCSKMCWCDQKIWTQLSESSHITCSMLKPWTSPATIWKFVLKLKFVKLKQTKGTTASVEDY